MAQFDAAVVSMPWYPCHDAQTPVCWSAPNVMYMTMPPQNTFVANPHALSLADAIPLSQEHTNVRVTEEATTGLRSSVGMRQPRTGCRAEARRRRDVPNCRRRETQHDSLQGSGNATSSSACDTLVNDAPGTESLRSHFSELDGVPCGRIFLVRKIQRLGLGSADAVQAHFSAYGDVENVLVAHSPVLSGCKTYVRRLRPSNLAIVIMRTPAMAERVHREGRDHVVNGSSVCVEPYQRRGETQGKAEAELDTTSCDAESTFDGGSSGNSDVFSEVDDEDACISGQFEYWATDDEGEW